MSKEKIKSFLGSQCVLIVSILLAVITSFLSVPSWNYINFKVLILLFNLMIVVAALNECKVLDKAAIVLLKRCTTYKKVSFVLVFITFISAMFITNDVALITFIPFTIIVGKKSNIRVLKIIVFQTLAANIGSSLTPMGNPQNLFIYSYYEMFLLEFLKITLPIFLLGGVFLSILIFKEKDDRLNFKVEDIDLKNKYKIFIIIVLFIIIILSVFNIVDYKMVFVLTVLIVSILDMRLFAKVDYSLLFIFIGFFIFIGNISQMPIVKEFMGKMFNSNTSIYFKSILVSQIISNVPATVLISGFTEYSKELLLAVNIGGMGTLIASLASLISYNIYVKEYREESRKFLQVFTIYNLIGLILFVPIIYFTMVK